MTATQRHCCRRGTAAPAPPPCLGRSANTSPEPAGAVENHAAQQRQGRPQPPSQSPGSPLSFTEAAYPPHHGAPLPLPPLSLGPPTIRHDAVLARGVTPGSRGTSLVLAWGLLHAAEREGGCSPRPVGPGVGGEGAAPICPALGKAPLRAASHGEEL